MIRHPLSYCTILALLCLGLWSCGKVTQTSQPLAPIPASFSLSFELNLATSANASLFTPAQTPIFGSVTGVKYKDKGPLSQPLSWGKALLKTDKDSRFSSQSFRKDGVEMRNSGESWLLISYNPSTAKWLGSSTLLPLNYDGYVVHIFSKTSLYSRYIPLESGMTTPLLVVDKHSTFLVNIWDRLQVQFPNTVTSNVAFQKLSEVFSLPFFKLISYQLPTSSVQSDGQLTIGQMPKSASFLASYFYYLSKDRKKAEDLLTSTQNRFLTPDAKKHLKLQLK